MRTQPHGSAVSEGFRFDCPGARAVFLVGDFNGWRMPGLPMRRSAGMTWEARVALAPGRHLLTCYAEFNTPGAPMDPDRDRCWPAELMRVEVGAAPPRGSSHGDRELWSWARPAAAPARTACGWIDLVPRAGDRRRPVSVRPRTEEAGDE